MARARRSLIPGGVNSPVRALRAVGRDAAVHAPRRGREIDDADGNRYVDLVSPGGR